MKKLYIISVNGELLPHTASTNKDECLVSYAEEVSDNTQNPDFDSVHSSVINNTVPNQNIQCYLYNITLSD